MRCARGIAAGKPSPTPLTSRFLSRRLQFQRPGFDVGPFSSGLAAKNEPEFVGDDRENEKGLGHPQFRETYVPPRVALIIRVSEDQFTGFIRPICGRLFASLMTGQDGPHGRSRVRTPPQNALTVCGPVHQRICLWRQWIVASRSIERVRREGKIVPDLTKIYPRVWRSSRKRRRWDTGNKTLNEGMTKLLMTLQRKGNYQAAKDRTRHGSQILEAAEQGPAERIGVITSGFSDSFSVSLSNSSN